MKNLPEEFTDRMQRQLGDENFKAFVDSLNAPAPTSIRINPHKFKHALSQEKVNWCPNGYYLPERPVFVADPMWHAGAYYVQEASSMALEQAFVVIKEKNNGQLSVLDLCAAPGGKSTHIASLLSGDDVLVSNEVIKSRVGVLNENLAKWGYPNTIITNADSKDFEQCGELFDVIVVDAPCSGEGLFRKDDNAINEWSAANATMCALRQKRILEQILNCLKPGGFLVYSTCTFNPGENELQVEALTRQGYLPVEFNLNDAKNFMHQFYPNQIKGEGFFIALLQKEMTEPVLTEKKKTLFLKPVKDTGGFAGFINKVLPFYTFKNNVIALSDLTRELFEKLHPLINCYTLGTRVYENNSKLVIPSEYLPFSALFNASDFEIKSVELAEAIMYLSKQALPHVSGNKGYVVIQFNGVNLGFGKLAGNRINNLFPNEWRLRRSIKPEEFFSISNFAG